MKTSIALVIMCGILPGMADGPAIKEELLQGWGTAQDPAADCKFSLKEGKLTISVPGSDKAHDLSAEMGNVTAPRVVQALSGDFRIQVKVEGPFQPGEESAREGRTGYTGAGLVIFADTRNYVRIERASPQAEGSRGARPYTNFEIRVDGELQHIGTTGDLPTENGKPTWLRLEKKGRQILGSMSQDGVTWTAGNPKVLESKSWTNNTVLAGVAAINSSRKEFSPVFSEISVTQESGATKAKGESKAEPKIEPKSDIKPESKQVPTAGYRRL